MGANIAAQLGQEIEAIAGRLASMCVLKSRKEQNQFAVLNDASVASIRRYGTSMAKYKLKKKLSWIHGLLSQRHDKHVAPTLEEMAYYGAFQPKAPMTALVDLGAFPLEGLKKGMCEVSLLTKLGIRDVVLMEDRNPLFFLNYRSFKGMEVVPLNKHLSMYGSNDILPWTMQDLKHLVQTLQQGGVRVHIGFWGHIDDNAYNPFIQQNRKALCPAIPGSDDLNPLSFVKHMQGEELFSSYIIRQFCRLKEDFGFDGLFLGDGLLGYRSFLDPLSTKDFSYATKAWSLFIQHVAEGVHRRKGLLSSFDVMGRTFSEAKFSGVDYREVLTHMDVLYVQTYGQTAWNEYMRIPGYDLDRDQAALESIYREISPKQRRKLQYTLEIRDSLEGWEASKEHMKHQIMALDPFAAGKLGVWANEVVKQVLMGDVEV